MSKLKGITSPEKLEDKKKRNIDIDINQVGLNFDYS